MTTIVLMTVMWVIPGMGVLGAKPAAAQDSGFRAGEWHRPARSPEFSEANFEPTGFEGEVPDEIPDLSEDWHSLAAPQSVEYPAGIAAYDEYTAYSGYPDHLDYPDHPDDWSATAEGAADEGDLWASDGAGEHLKHQTAPDGPHSIEAPVERTLISAEVSREAEVDGEPKPPALPDNAEWVAAWVNDLKQSSEAWIQIDLSDQQLIAWEGNTPVFSVTVSTGRASNMEDITPTGVYAIEDKYRTARMQGENYDIPDVPYTMYFSGSYAIHGAYWHDNFGNPVSSGCINVPVEQAAWLFNWAPIGTRVVVQN